MCIRDRYDRTAKGQALLQRMQVYSQRISKGGTITPAQLVEMSDLAQTFNEQATAYNARERAHGSKVAEAFGLRPELIYVEDEGEDAPGPAAPGAVPPAGGNLIYLGNGKFGPEK